MSLGCGKGQVQHTRALLRVGEGDSGEVGVGQGLLHYRNGGRQVEGGEGLLRTHTTPCCHKSKLCLHSSWAVVRSGKDGRLTHMHRCDCVNAYWPCMLHVH